MIIVRVELHSAITGNVTELARMEICNDGRGSENTGHYQGGTLVGRAAAALDRGIVNRKGEVRDYPRQRLHVWHLVARMLDAMGYN
jgi:hypothetical protein